MARKPRTTKKVPEAAADLLAALDFVKVAQQDEGDARQTHCRIGGGVVAANNGVISAAYPLADDIDACPHTLKLRHALSKCGQSFKAVAGSGSLVVRSGGYRATVPCADPQSLPDALPDPSCAIVDDRIKASLLAVAPLAAEGSERVAFAAVLLRAGSAVATNGRCVLEHWHGLDLPPGLVIPKASALAIAKVAAPLVGFGFSQNSATFHYEGGAWIKTQLYAEAYPDVSRVLDADATPKKMQPKKMADAWDAVSHFCEQFVYFRDGEMRSHWDHEAGASYAIPGLPDQSFNAKDFALVLPMIDTVDWQEYGKPAYFYGENLRGAIIGAGQRPA